MHYVTSASYEALTNLYTGNFTRKFTIGDSDYSAYVVQWPKFKRAWNDIKPGDMSIKLANHDNALNFFRDTPVSMRTTCTVQAGVDSDLISFFSGKVDRVSFSDAKVTLNVTDNFKQLSQRKVGTSDVPVDFTGSSYLVSDLAWYLCTSYGGLSTVASTSNPDIDYSTFLAWASVFSADSVFVKARFDGQSVNEAIRIISRITESAIFVSNSKIAFHRYNIADTPTAEYLPGVQGSFSVELRDDDVINKQIVSFDYSVASDYFTKSVFSVDSTSIDSYGLREYIEEDDKVWYVDSTSALNYSQRITVSRNKPFDRIDTTITREGILSEVGDTVTLVDSHLAVSAVYRVMSTEVDIHNATARIVADRSQFVSGFILDSSVLDGTDILT